MSVYSSMRTRPHAISPSVYSADYYICIYVSSCYYVCPHTTICVLMLLYVCPRTTVYVSSYYYICVPIPLYMCPHTTIYVSSCYYMCVLELLSMCPHTTVYYCVLILLSSMLQFLTSQVRALARTKPTCTFAPVKQVTRVPCPWQDRTN